MKKKLLFLMAVLAAAAVSCKTPVPEPKHDYSGDVGGCHPGSQAMKFIAEKIYNELGAWLEE